MSLHRPAYRIALDTHPDADLVVEVLPGDQLRAETEGNRRGLVDPGRQAIMLTLLWLWAATRRLDLVDKSTPFDVFVDDRLTAWERVKPTDDEEQIVHPTQEAASSTPASSSQPAFPDSIGSASSTTTPPSSPPPSDSSHHQIEE